MPSRSSAPISLKIVGSVFSWRNISRTRGDEPVLRIRARRIADHPLFVGELLLEQERVAPVEVGPLDDVLRHTMLGA